MHGDEFVWDEFVGDELLGDESSRIPNRDYVGNIQGPIHGAQEEVI